MKAVSYSEGKVFTSNLDYPSGEGVLVNIESAGICGSDLHLLNSGAHSPHVAGHEIAGITSNGTHVAIEPIISCQKCLSCIAGDYHLCKTPLPVHMLSVLAAEKYFSSPSALFKLIRM